MGEGRGFAVKGKARLFCPFNPPLQVRSGIGILPMDLRNIGWKPMPRDRRIEPASRVSMRGGNRGRPRSQIACRRFGFAATAEFFHETIGTARILGTLVICIGVFLISRTQ